jgi:hypothetical protein
MKPIWLDLLVCQIISGTKVLSSGHSTITHASDPTSMKVLETYSRRVRAQLGDPMELSRCVGCLDRLLTTSDIHKVTLFTKYKS